VSNFEIGRYIQQSQGFKAFVPYKFPPEKTLDLPKKTASSQFEAVRLLGKLDGATRLLPDRDIFLLMFINKDATSSNQIEGTTATMMDVIEQQNVEPRQSIPADVDDITHYINALDYGIKRAEAFPFTLPFIREIHEKLMAGARAAQLAYPGEFRTAQNWIGGTRPDTARFVPPPADEMNEALGDLERFIHADDEFLPLVKAALLHAQFETIHPFNDGNGRTGRMLITMFIWHEKLLERPVLYLSSFFKQHQSLYYEKLEGYHSGKVIEWIDFFLEGVITTAESAITTCERITELRERDMRKIQALGKTAASSTLRTLVGLYRMPVVGIADVTDLSGLTPVGSYKLIDRLVDMGILRPLISGEKVYGQKWVYADYLHLFDDDISVI
jgi:Fic family protein